jgi:peptide/nickel transport system substrate-binding protein
MRWTKVVALAAAGTLSLAACGGGSSPADTANNQASESAGTGGESPAANPTSDAPEEKASAGFMPDAKGPAPEIAGAKKGGTLIINAAGAPTTFDPSGQFIQDVNQILKQYVTRTLTGYSMRDGKSVLVPDLATDLGTVSDDGLTWTFTLKKGLKYEDGSTIKADDVAYAIKRSFAQEELPGGPTYQLDYLKDGDKYKGPYKDGDKFAGVEAKGDQVIFHLRKKWPTLPYFGAFTQTSPIPKAKDTKTEYTKHPLSTGPYKFSTYKQGVELTLVRNDQWDPKSDPIRHAFPDKVQFNFAQDAPKVAASIMASNGPDAFTLSYDGVDASIYNKATTTNKDQVSTAAGPCVSYVTMDTRKIPRDVREAIAMAWPYEAIRKGAQMTKLDYSPASSIMAPQVPGFDKYEPIKLPGGAVLNGEGNGDPAKAKQMLKDAGKENFALSYYYSIDNPLSVQVNTVRKQLLEKAGFKVKDIGLPRTEVREKTILSKSDANLMQGASGWCYDWPSGDGVYPALFKSSLVKSQQTYSTGFLSDPKLDKEIDRISGLPVEEQGPEWSTLDEKILKDYLPLLPDYNSKASAIYGTKVKNVIVDPNQGMPEFASIWLDQ